MRVLHVIDSLGAGGAETLLYRLLRAQLDIEQVVVSLGARDWYSEQIEALKVPVHHLENLSMLSASSAVLAIHRLIKQTQADVVQGWLYRSNMLSGLAAAAAGVPRVWSVHCASLAPLSPSARLFVRSTGIAARWIPNVIVNCSGRSAEVHATLGYSKAECVIVHNGYDASEFFPQKRESLRVREELGIPADAFLIGCISRWNAFKDIPNLIDATVIASRAGVPLKCILIGSGLETTNGELMRALAHTGCAELFLPLGRRTDVATFARAMDLHVLPSASEAFPNAVAETMLSGAPNVVTDVGDAALIVGDAGWVVPPRNPGELAGAIEAAFHRWKSRPKDWQRMRAAARERVAHNFSLERMATAYEQVWRSVLLMRRGKRRNSGQMKDDRH